MKIPRVCRTTAHVALAAAVRRATVVVVAAAAAAAASVLRRIPAAEDMIQAVVVRTEPVQLDTVEVDTVMVAGSAEVLEDSVEVAVDTAMVAGIVDVLKVDMLSAQWQEQEEL